MGIPSYFAFLVNKYPEIIKNNLKKKVGRVYLDLNCAIHPCCRKVLSEYSESLDENLLEKKMINEINTYIKTIYLYTDPNDLLFIAIDGPAPRAKMSQQRQRRYKSIKEKKTEKEIRESNGEIIKKIWDTNAITPGTLFMDKVTEGIINFIEGNDLFKKIQVIFSDSNSCGEGEHKILNHIRNNDKTSDDYYDIIYGLDADLIMLSLASKKDNICLLREPNNFNQNDIDLPFLYLDIDTLKLSFLNEIETRIKDLEINNLTKINFNINLHNFTIDYIFLCYFFGNDFIPHIPSLDIKDGGIDNLIEIYLDIVISYNKFLIDNNKIENDIFIELLHRLSELEENTLFNIQKRRNNFKLRYNDELESLSEIQLFEMHNYPMKNKDIENKVNVTKEGWQKRYYKYCFDNIDLNDTKLKNLINKYCNDYLEGLIWTFNYYIEGCASWNWFYNYRHSPLISDIYNFIKNNDFDINSINFKKDSSNNPFTQLLMVLPSESKHLLPKSYQYLVSNIESDIIDLYPIDFEVDTFHKRYLWQCPPIIPNIDYNRIIKSIEKCKLTPNESKRNTLKSNYYKKKNYSLKFE